MTCLGPNYNPIPPRAWSRVQNQCTFDLEVPLNIHRNQIIKKGNILQYKKNSSGLTQQQRYSQIAKGMWTNRTTTWASQTQTATNPNILNLKQVNFTPVPLPFDDPFIINQYGCVQTYIKEGGTLLGNTYVNPCTDEVIKKTYVTQCSPTSASDVPGPEMLLCWPSKLQTWYPKSSVMQTMNNSLNKWPVNYKLFRSANSLKPYSKYTLSEYTGTIYSTAMSNSQKALANAQQQQQLLQQRGAVNLYTYIYNNFKGDSVSSTTTTDNATMNVKAANLNVTIIQNEPPVVINFAEIQAKTPLDLEANFGVTDYAVLATRVSYIFPKYGNYIAKNTVGSTNVMLPLKLDNYSDIIITNSSENTIKVLTNQPTQTINNYFFARDVDNFVTISKNVTGSFRFIVADEETGSGNWIVNIF